MYKKIFISFIFSIISFFMFGQDSLTVYKFWIGFKDKNGNQYSLDHPEEFLSERALNRRARFNIPVDSLDLPVSKVYIDSIKNTGLEITTVSKWLNGCVVKTNDTSSINNISHWSFVKEVKRVFYKVDTDSYSQSIYKTRLKGDYGYANLQVRMLNADYLHNMGYDGTGLIIAVIDAGFKRMNEFSFFDNIFNNYKIVAKYDFVDNDTSVFEKAYHGTGVVSVIGAYKPNELVGIATGVDFMLLISEDVTSEQIVEEYNWAAAAEFADSAGADLINSSLGYTTFDDSLQNHTYQSLDGETTPAAKAANIAFDKGMIVVVSAGNSGNKPWHYISTPGDAKKALTVGAVDPDGNYAPFSSTGPTPDGRIKPDVAALGAPAAACYDGDSVSFVSGTSFASPIMCGAVACLWQAFPNMTNSQIVEAVKISSSQASNPDSLLGYGIPDFELAYDYLYNLQQNVNTIPDTDNEVIFYPNPIKDRLNIKITSHGHKQIYLGIYDMTGNLLYIADLSKYSSYSTISIGGFDNLEKGVYTAKLLIDNRIYIKKIVKL